MVYEKRLPKQESKLSLLKASWDCEGVPGAVMDGMAVGLVHVCLDIPGGLRELVIPEKTGLLVSDRSKDFMAAVDRLVENADLRSRLSESARRHVDRDFSLTSSADKWEKLFADLRMHAGPRKPIVFPSRLRLPAPHAKLTCGDHRKPSTSPQSMLRQRLVAAIPLGVRSILRKLIPR